MKIIFHRLADRELSDAFWFYEDQVDGLGSLFLDNLQHSARLLLTFPKAAPVIRSFADVTVRKRSLPKFPYDIIFSFDDDHLYILAIAHQKRRPLYWMERVDDISEGRIR